MKNLLTFICFALWFPFAVLAQDYSTQKKITSEVVKNFEEGKASQIYTHFDENMQSSISADKLTQIWNSLPAQCGGYLGAGTADVDEMQGMVVVHQFLDFEKLDLELRLAFNDKNEIAGLFFVPAVKKKE